MDAAPAHLSAAAQDAWVELVGGLDAGSVTGATAGSIEAYAVQVARMRDAQRRIDAEGLVVADAKGQPMPHPAIVIERAAQAEVRAWAARIS